MGNATFPFDLPYRGCVPLPHGFHGLLHIPRHNQKRDLKDALTRGNLFLFASFWIVENDLLPKHIKGRFCPKIITKMSELVFNLAEMAKGYFRFISKRVNDLEAHKITKRIHPENRISSSSNARLGTKNLSFAQ